MFARYTTSVVLLVLAFCWSRRNIVAAAMTAANASSSLLNSDDTDGFLFTTDNYYATMMAEFVFNVAGDHILYPVPSNREDDLKLHKNAAVVADMLQKLHIIDRLYRLLNDTARDVVADKTITIDNPNLIKIILDKVIEKIVNDRDLLAEFVECGGNRDYRQESTFLAADHAKYASSKVQTMYDISSDQFIRAAELLDDVRVKKLVMSVSLLKASDYDVSYRFIPASVRENTKLAKNILILASRVELRERIQRIYDDTLNDCADKFDVISGDIRDMFDRLRVKLNDDSVLKKELEILNKL